jgi:hypothetical protein
MTAERRRGGYRHVASAAGPPLRAALMRAQGVQCHPLLHHGAVHAADALGQRVQLGRAGARAHIRQALQGRLGRGQASMQRRQGGRQAGLVCAGRGCARAAGRCLRAWRPSVWLQLRAGCRIGRRLAVVLPLR